MNNVPALHIGDLLLYSGSGMFSKLIRIKTWSRYSHCEVVDGFGLSVASRAPKRASSSAR